MQQHRQCNTDDTDWRLAEMNDPNVDWRCPCVGLECESLKFLTL